MNCVEFDFSEYKPLFEKLKQAANGDLKKEMTTFVQTIATNFLEVVQDEIMRRKVIDTRLLLSSLHRGEYGNVWEVSDDGLTVEVGTNIDYASYVNDGHWTNPKGVKTRFVPGTWEGDRFIYDPSADTGMALKQQWVEGAHFWDSALRIFDKMFPKILEAKLQDWIDKYFDGVI